VPGNNLIAVILAAYAAFVLLLSTMAACVAMFVGDAERRDSAYRVLKLVLTTGTGTGGVVALAVQLYQHGFF
jgi:hypothetical protein